METKILYVAEILKCLKVQTQKSSRPRPNGFYYNRYPVYRNFSLTLILILSSKHLTALFMGLNLVHHDEIATRTVFNYFVHTKVHTKVKVHKYK